ncbi:MAG TPA: DUF3500 domain-containing protein [Vicinamibacteria bacterium]|nr:DUF3500 domain-containing protein [Vicinamibacteria bacterium]
MRYRIGVAFLALAAGAFAQQTDRAAREMVSGATHFLSALTDEQLSLAKLPFAGEERTNWHYIPRDRKGVPYKVMTPAQRKLADSLLASGLSHGGMRKALEIMYLDQILFERERRDIRDPEAYYFTVFGEPSASGTWGFRVEGHHLSLNFSLRDGEVASSSPAFMGANPAIVPEGSHKGMRVLAEEEVLGRALHDTLADRRVLIDVEAPRDIVTEASRRAEIGEPKGVAYADMTPEQKEAMLQLIRLYAYRMRPDLAERELSRIADRGLDAIHFAWAGGAEPGEPHYYRIHGPTFLVEYDNTQNDANHIHTVWRDLEGDFGGVDPLTDHYARSPHHRHLHVSVGAEPSTPDDRHTEPTRR